MESTWDVGTITVPSSPGSVSVTGLSGTPKALLFYGANWTTEDSVITSSGSALFRGMCGDDVFNPGNLIQSAATVTPTGDCHEMTSSYAILNHDTSGSASTLYAATVDSFDSDGFTVTFATAATGGYKVVYIALMDAANCIAALHDYSTAFNIGFKASAGLFHGAWAGPDIVGTDRTQEFYGGAAWPGGSNLGWQAASLTAETFPTSISGQYLQEINLNDPTVVTATTASFTGPFLVSSNLFIYPTGSGLEDMFHGGGGGAFGMLVAWDDEDNWNGQFVVPQNSGDTNTVSLGFAPGLVIGYTISDEPGGQGTGARGAVGFSVATPDFQWCAIADQVDAGAFMSFQRGLADGVHNTDVHTGTIEFSDDGFTTTTQEDSGTAQVWTWHAFGHPKPLAVPPQFYRVLPGGKIVQPVIPPRLSQLTGTAGAEAIASGSKVVGYLLLESGDRIILEEGSAFLVL